MNPSSKAAPTATGLRQSMAWIHGWLGLLAGWILFAMFLTGTASYFRPEITLWMQPELRIQSVSPARAAQTAVAHLQSIATDDEQWFIYLPDERTPATRIFVKPRAVADSKALPPKRQPEIRLDPASGQPLAARETRGGEHFYRFHFQLQIPHPWGRWLAGLCAMFMLGAIISGVITHKRIFADFFTLRWGKGKRSWLDVHNASAVLALPFHAMITYTGLITLVMMYMPWPVMANYAPPTEFAADAYGAEPEGPTAGKAAPLVAVAPLIEAAQREWGGRAGQIVIRHANDAAATITVTRSGGDRLNARGQSITFSGATGKRLSASPAPGAAIETAGVMLGLHMGQFAGPVLRWAYFILGLTGAAMVGTGSLLWTIKRRKPGAVPFVGLRLVERLNVAAIACLPTGMAAFFLANRFIRAAMPDRAALEVSAFFWTWFGLALLLISRPLQRAWTEGFAIAALAFAAIPIVNALTTDRGLVASIAKGDGLFIAFDMAALMIGALFGFAAWRSARIPTACPRTERLLVQTPEMMELANAS